MKTSTAGITPSPRTRNVLPHEPSSALPLREHPGEGEDEQQLPELRRLEGEEAEADPAGRAVRRVADEEHDRDQAARRGEDGAPVAPVHVRVDERGDHEDRAAGDDVEDLAVQVVRRVVGDGEPRHARHAHSPTATSAATPLSRIQSSERTTASRPTPVPFGAKPASLRSGVFEHQAVTSPSGWGRSWLRGRVKKLREDPFGRRRGGRPALAAVLDHCADDDRGIVRGTIAAPPRLVFLLGEAGQRHVLLGRARLAGDRHGEAAEDAVRGAGREMRRRRTALVDDPDVARIEAAGPASGPAPPASGRPSRSGSGRPRARAA